MFSKTADSISIEKTSLPSFKTTKDLRAQAELILKASPLKVTQPRILILKVLLEKHGPLSTEEIFKSLRRGQCDLATVYRTLSALLDAQLIQRCNFGDAIARYEMINTNHTSAHSSLKMHEKIHSHHHHIMCKSCNQIEPLEICVTKDWKGHIEELGYSKVSHHLEFSGLCRQCTNPSTTSSITNRQPTA